MTEIAELEQRIARALARITAGVERLDDARDAAGQAPSAAQADLITHLETALDAERAARSELSQRLANRPPPVEDLAPEVARLTRQLDAQSLDNQRLRSSVAQLREEVRRLREAAQHGTADAALISRALQSEMEALRAARASETTEIAEILAVLSPMIDAEEGRPHA
jgi:chromosome segregation ATPase